MFSYHEVIFVMIILTKVTGKYNHLYNIIIHFTFGLGPTSCAVILSLSSLIDKIITMFIILVFDFFPLTSLP